MGYLLKTVKLFSGLSSSLPLLSFSHFLRIEKPEGERLGVAAVASCLGAALAANERSAAQPRAARSQVEAGRGGGIPGPQRSEEPRFPPLPPVPGTGFHLTRPRDYT